MSSLALQDLRPYAIKRERLERAVFVGPMGASKQVMKTLHDNGWNIVQSGPYFDDETWPRCDVTRFKFVAECVLETEGTS